MGWDIQSGYTGYISFGHSVLSGGAAYTTALLLTQIDPGLSLWVTAPASVLAAVLIGLVIALPSLRLTGPYFSLITFVAVLLFYQLTLAVSDLGGQSGLGIDRVLSPADPTATYYAVLVPMLFVAVGLTFLARSNLGLILIAVRENETAVSAAGINPTKFKIWSFTLSSVAMGIGGVLLTAMVSNVTPTQFVVVDRSIEMIAIAVLGGMSSILGPLGGSFLFFILRDGFLTLFVEGAVRNFLLFFFVILVLVFARDGLFRKLWHRLGAVGGDDS
jgi:branched-chain amino acid transport system permease protein